MQGERYTVRAGDNLWNISRARLGQGAQWPRIWRYNNRRDVMRVTGRGIANPDLIHPGQVLLLPILSTDARGRIGAGPNGASPLAPSRQSAPPRPAPTQPAPQQTPPSGGSLNDRLRTLESPISFKYRLDDLRFPPIDTPAALIEMRITGDVLLMTQRAYPALYVTQRREIELQVTQEANHAFGRLVSDNRVIFDSGERRLTVRSMLVSQSNMPNAPSTAVGVQMDSSAPIPKLRFELRYPKLEGSIPPFNYTAVDVKIVVEVTPKPNLPRGPSAQPVRAPGINWNKVLGTGLIVVGGAIVVGTLVEDFFSAGVGAADDPASFAAAGASVTRGLALMRATAAALPAAVTPAMVNLSVRLAPMAFGAGQLVPAR